MGGCALPSLFGEDRLGLGQLLGGLHDLPYGPDRLFFCIFHSHIGSVACACSQEMTGKCERPGMADMVTKARKSMALESAGK